MDPESASFMAGLQSGDEIISMNGEQVMSLSLLLLSPHGMLQEFWVWGGKPSVPADFPSRLASQDIFLRPWYKLASFFGVNGSIDWQN